MTDAAPRRRPLSAGKKLGFAAVTCLLGVLGLEAALRVAGYPQGLVRSFSKLWNPDPSSRAEVPGLFRPSFAGRVLYPPELAYDVRFNALGLRGEAPGDGPRLLLLGDSVTFGYHVGEAEAYPAVLQARLREAGLPQQVLNAGCGHFTITDERRYLSERLLALEPAAVVLQFCSNDLLDLELARQPTLYEQVLTDDDAPGWLSQTALGEVVLQVQVGLKRWRKGPQEALGLEPQQPAPTGAWETYEAELTQLRDLLAAREIPLVLIAFPDLVAALDDQPSPLDAKLGEICARLGIPFRSALAAFRAVDDPQALYLYPLDPHASPAGNALFADEALALLREAALLP